MKFSSILKFQTLAWSKSSSPRQIVARLVSKSIDFLERYFNGLISPQSHKKIFDFAIVTQIKKVSV